MSILLSRCVIQNLIPRSQIDAVFVGQPQQRSVTMSRLSTPAPDSATGATPELPAPIKTPAGNGPNTYPPIDAHGTAALNITLHASAVLATGLLSRQDHRRINVC